MSKIVGLTCAAMLLLLTAAAPQSGQFSKYKAVEAYEIRPGILMMPRYSADGQVCEIGLEKLHYSPEIIRLDSSLSRAEIDQLFNELVPADERGPRSKDFERDLITQEGGGITTTAVFENVTIQIFGKDLSAPHKHEIVEDDIVAIVRWKNRKCQ
jgi:hypothetical protein